MQNDGGVNSTMIYLIYCKNLCKCHNVSPSSTIKKEERKKQKEKTHSIPGFNSTGVSTGKVRRELKTNHSSLCCEGGDLATGHRRQCWKGMVLKG
jgi:hypothetical protein